MGETASGPASQWYVSEWSLANYINPANVVVDDTANIDPVYGIPLYSFSNADETQNLSAYQAANGNWIYGLTADNGSLGNTVGGANLFLSTSLSTPITLNNTVNYQVDLRETAAVSGSAPVFAFTGFTLTFNVAGSSTYNAAWPTISMFLQIDITDSRGADTMTDYDTATVSADGRSMAIIAAGILPEDPSLAFGVQNATYDVVYSSLNTYLTNFLQQTYFITQASGSSSFGTLEPEVLNLADWTLNGVYIGTEDDGTGPITTSSSQLGLQISNLLLSTTTAAPTLAGSISEVPNTGIPGQTSLAQTEPSNPSGAVPSEASTIIDGYYQTILGRSADTAGLASWVAAVNAGMSYAQVESDLANSAEAQNDISNLYLAELGRAPDPSGLAGFTQYLAAGGSLAVVCTAIADSAEAQNDISNLYLAELGRAPDPSGLAGCTQYLAAGGSLAVVRTAIADSPEAQADVTTLLETDTGSAPTAAAIATGQTQLADGLSLTDLNTQTLNLAANPASFLGLTGGTATFTGSGAALFGFGPGSFAQNTIVGFNPATDILELSQTQFPTLTAVQADLSQTINGALITLDPSNTILLSGVATGSLVNADYRFV